MRDLRNDLQANAQSRQSNQVADGTGDGAAQIVRVQVPASRRRTVWDKHLILCKLGDSTCRRARAQLLQAGQVAHAAGDRAAQLIPIQPPAPQRYGTDHAGEGVDSSVQSGTVRIEWALAQELQVGQVADAARDAAAQLICVQYSEQQNNRARGQRIR